MKIAAAATAFPSEWYPQEQISERLVSLLGMPEGRAERLRELHRNCGIDGRHLTLPLDAYADLDGFTDANQAWLRGAVQLGEEACLKALQDAGVRPDEVDAIFFSTVTGLASPSVDGRLVGRLGLRSDVRRVPMFGLGCVAGAAAAVVVGSGRDAAGPTIEATRSVFYPDSEDMMGWHIGAHGFRIVLSAEVPTVARERVPKDVDAFLAERDLSRADVQRWIAHPGGPKVLRGLQEGLGLDDDALAISWQSLARAGNLSSSSVLMILAETLRQRPGDPGDVGVMLAMGPGFCSELLLLRWS